MQVRGVATEGVTVHTLLSPGVRAGVKGEKAGDWAGPLASEISISLFLQADIQDENHNIVLLSIENGEQDLLQDVKLGGNLNILASFKREHKMT